MDENLKCTWWLRRDRSWDFLKGAVSRGFKYTIYNTDRYIICDGEMRESEGYLKTPRGWPKMRINRYGCRSIPHIFSVNKNGQKRD